MLFAAVTSPLEAASTRAAMSRAVITVPANSDVEAVHDRMPAVIAALHATEWLTTRAGQLLVPAPPSTLVGTLVSSRANSVANDDPECFSAPAPPTRRRPQQLPLLGDDESKG
jgi:putative SOS response-associated peptidase YedK